MPPKLRAITDPALGARVVTRWPLRYGAGADPAEDRPAHVRAGSGLAWFGGVLAVVQDDASFLALVDPTTREVGFLALPRGPGGLRQFDEGRGNKRDKLDLEACAVATIDGRETLLAFGSGSTAERERIVVAQRAASPGHFSARVAAAPALYAALRECRDFSGSELNVEGVVITGDRVRFFQRGNGSRDGALPPVSATGEVTWEDLLATLDGEPRRTVRVEGVRVYDLGDIDGTALTFTDGAPGPGGSTLYLATAEASPDAVRDGPVAGTVVGVIDGDRVRSTLLTDTSGAPFLEKAEGLALSRTSPHRAFVVLDADDPARPADLCEVELSGPWQ